MDVKRIGVRIESQFHDVSASFNEALFCCTESHVENSGGGGNSSNTADKLRNSTEADDESSEVYTEGELHIDGDKYEVCYFEPYDVTAIEHAMTTIFFEESARSNVTITRTGSSSMAIVLERGVRHECAYGTRRMPFVIYITAKYVKNEITPSGGVLDMAYTVDTLTGTVQLNRIKVTVMVRE